ncbi:MAG: hypothetical protein ABIO70_25125 [Pseudomonadota bacterium]
MSKQVGDQDPLQSPRLSERVEAVRQLGVAGGPEVLDTLLDMALEDRSSGVRLAAASAAADILSRSRLAPRREDLSEAARRAILQRLRAVDPGRNTSLFQVLASVGLPEALLPIARGVRDPRVDVRTGALVGLARLCCSGAVNGDAQVERTLAGLLGETRLRPDVSVEIARIAHRAGYLRLRGDVARMAGCLGDRWRGAAEEILAAMPGEQGVEAAVGCWIGGDLDCGEVRARYPAGSWLAVVPGQLLLGAGGDLALHPWSLDGDGFTCAGLSAGRSLPLRRLRAWMNGLDGVEVLQLGARSWAAAHEKDLPELVDSLAAAGFDEAGRRAFAAALLEVLTPGLSERSTGAYTRAVLLAEAGRDAEACAALEPLAGRGRPEACWHLHRARARLGQGEAAGAALDAYLQLASRRSRFLKAARALRESREG